MAAAGLKQVLGFSLTPGQAHDTPPARELSKSLGLDNLQLALIMDRAYEGNDIKRLFGRIKRFRRVFTRYDKTDIMFSAFITLALIADLLR